MIIENQDLEEKKLVKMVRVMKAEKLREFKGLERVRQLCFKYRLCREGGCG